MAVWCGLVVGILEILASPDELWRVVRVHAFRNKVAKELLQRAVGVSVVTGHERKAIYVISCPVHDHKRIPLPG